jgi:hypothetical protein
MALMPIVVSVNGSVSIFSSVEALERDLSAGDFTYAPHQVFDAKGRKGQLAIVEREATGLWRILGSPDRVVTVTAWEPEPTATKTLEQLLRAALEQVGEPAPANWSLEQLLDEAAKWFGE